MTRVAIIAAMPGELKPLVKSGGKGWHHELRNGVHLWRYRFDEVEWIAACAGAGVKAATRAFSEIQKDGPLSAVFSIGWAGALSDEFKAGAVYSISGVIDARTGERFPANGSFEECWLVTSPRVADATEKQRFAATYGAALVDMEASAVARLAAMRDIPFYCIKGVSDAFADKLPDFNRFILPDGRFSLASFIVFALLRPNHWPALIRMGENSKSASRGLAKYLLDFLDQSATIRTRNGYPYLKS